MIHRRNNRSSLCQQLGGKLVSLPLNRFHDAARAMMIRDALAAHGWDQRTMAIVRAWSESKVSRMISDETQMSAADALIVAEVLPELSAEALLSAQSEFELARARLLYRPKSVALPRTDSERYAELRKLVEAFQSAKSYEDDAPLQALRDWSHR